jgi:hypothetical protein
MLRPRRAWCEHCMYLLAAAYCSMLSSIPASLLPTLVPFANSSKRCTNIQTRHVLHVVQKGNSLGAKPRTVTITQTFASEMTLKTSCCRCFAAAVTGVLWTVARQQL